MDLGFESAGFTVVWVNEVHTPFLNAYKYARQNMGIADPLYGYHNASVDVDHTGVQLSRIVREAADRDSLVGFIGGPPCPDFSVAGKNRGQHGDHGRLSQRYVDLILAHQPDFFVFENVKGLYRTKKHREFFNAIKQSLEVHYACSERLINAMEYGVPQDRQRIILAGIHKKHGLNAGIRLESHARYSEDSIRRYILSRKDHDSLYTDIPVDLTVQHWFEKNHVDVHPNSTHFFKPRSGLLRFQQTQEGDDSRKSYKRLHRYRYSPTAAYGHNEVHIHPTLPRRISAAEAMAIQSLPDSFVLPDTMSLTDMFKTIGNGVPYLAAKGIANSVKDALLNVQNSVEA